MKRRSFLKAGTAGIATVFAGGSGLLAWQPRANAATISRTLYINHGNITQPDGTSVYFRGFGSTSASLNVPAAPVIVQEGDTVRVTLVNRLGTSHSFVIDGVVDSGRISGGQTRTIEFPAPPAGSYLFYDGRNAPYNRLLGLHGGLAVMPAGRPDQLYAGSPRFVQQYFWVLNDIDPVWHARLRDGSTPSTAFKPRYFTINGQSSRPPGAAGHGDPAIDAMANPDTALHGHVGDRALIRLLNAGMCVHSVHWHGNHVEWLAENNTPRGDIWHKDVVRLRNGKGSLDVIYPFERPPDAWPRVSQGMYPMHLHDEMTQTAGGGLYLFGAMTDIVFE